MQRHASSIISAFSSPRSFGCINLTNSLTNWSGEKWPDKLSSVETNNISESSCSAISWTDGSSLCRRLFKISRNLVETPETIPVKARRVLEIPLDDPPAPRKLPRKGSSPSSSSSSSSYPRRPPGSSSSLRSPSLVSRSGRLESFFGGSSAAFPTTSWVFLTAPFFVVRLFEVDVGSDGGSTSAKIKLKKLQMAGEYISPWLTFLLRPDLRLDPPSSAVGESSLLPGGPDEDLIIVRICQKELYVKGHHTLDWPLCLSV